MNEVIIHKEDSLVMIIARSLCERGFEIAGYGVVYGVSPVSPGSSVRLRLMSGSLIKMEIQIYIDGFDLAGEIFTTKHDIYRNYTDRIDCPSHYDSNSHVYGDVVSKMFRFNLADPLSIDDFYDFINKHHTDLLR